MTTENLRKRIVFEGFPFRVAEAARNYVTTYSEVVDHLGGRFVVKFHDLGSRCEIRAEPLSKIARDECCAVKGLNGSVCFGSHECTRDGCNGYQPCSLPSSFDKGNQTP